jgi:nitroimidazol reductase NimA-like FMN-containing flavoprotein (pyridoxamine 5'-phosphate oxidase superfamily)
VEPQAARPRFPQGYGIAADEAGMLPWSRAVELLTASRNYWICTTREDGSPHAMPVWGVCVDGELYFGTSPESRKGRNLARDPRLVVHTESGDEVVVLEGTVQVLAALPGEVAAAYEAKYDWRPASEGLWYVVRPRVGYAFLERDFTGTATRYAF